MPGHTTNASYSYVEPSAHSTVLSSGRKALAAFLIQVAPFGMTEDSLRSEVLAWETPPPTRVQSGW